MEDLSRIVITSVDAVATVYSEKHRTLEMVNRPNFGLSFCIGGKITYTHKGNTFVSEPGYAVILPKGASYRLDGTEAGWFPLINFQCEHFSPETFTVIPLRNPDSYLAGYETLKNNMLFQHAHTKVMSILYDLFYRLSHEQTERHSLLAPATDYLENHFAEPTITNSLLAQKCGISEVYFRQLFHRFFHTSPKQYILDLRIRKARQLLTGSDLSVLAIAEQCGFTNPYHFSRTFKTVTGLTPTAYKRQNKAVIV